MRAGGSLLLVLLLVGSALAGCLQSSTIENSETEPEPEIPELKPEPLDLNLDHDANYFKEGLQNHNLKRGLAVRTTWLEIVKVRHREHSMVVCRPLHRMDNPSTERAPPLASLPMRQTTR